MRVGGVPQWGASLDNRKSPAFSTRCARKQAGLAASGFGILTRINPTFPTLVTPLPTSGSPLNGGPQLIDKEIASGECHVHASTHGGCSSWSLKPNCCLSMRATMRVGESCTLVVRSWSLGLWESLQLHRCIILFVLDNSNDLWVRHPRFDCMGLQDPSHRMVGAIHRLTQGLL